mgnify:CR=1 FL=1
MLTLNINAMKKTFIYAALFGASVIARGQGIPPNPIYFNTYYGTGAFASNVNGNSNAAFGPFALNKSTSANNNTAVGSFALYNATAGFNVAVGRRALYSNTTGISNTAVGTHALENTTYGLGNVAVGADALRYNVTGNWNTAVGLASGPGYGITNLIHATALGYAATNTANFQVRIGNDLITDIGGQVSWSTLSDGRFKRDIKEDIVGLEFINQLRPVSYTVDHAALARAHHSSDSMSMQARASMVSETRQTGFVAQEVESIIRKGNYRFNGVKVPENEMDHYSIRYAEFVVPLVKAVQELTAILNEQQNEIAALKERLEKADEGIMRNRTGDGGALLYQNYPNPFSTDTEIRMVLPESTRSASIIVYDLEGREMKRIAVDRPGTKALKVSGNDLAAGVYMYSLLADGKIVDTRRLIIVK